MSNYKHGITGMSEYKTWWGMIGRCTNPDDPAFKSYGGRGITVCNSWKQFINFFADMGNRPEGLTLERVNNDGGYSPDNCKWATWSEQNNNRRLRKDNKTGVSGVSWNKRAKKYVAYKKVQGKRIYLGYFVNLGEAAGVLKTFNEKKEV